MRLFLQGTNEVFFTDVSLRKIAMKRVLSKDIAGERKRKQ